MSLAKTLKYQRIKRGMTQEEFAKFIGMSRGSLAHYERGRKPLPKNVKIISDKIGIDIAKEIV